MESKMPIVGRGSGVVSSSGIVTTFVSSKPGAGAGADGDQALVILGTLMGLLFKKIAGAWKCVGQYDSPKRSTVYTVAERDAIAAELQGAEFWFHLTVQDGSNAPGLYSISDGVQTGPYVDASPA